MSQKSHNAGVADHRRDLHREIRQKHGSVRIDTLRKTYGEDFASGHRGDMKLDALLDHSGTKSLTEYLKRR